MNKYQQSRQVILDLLGKYNDAEKPMNEELLKIHIDGATEAIEGIYQVSDLVATDQEATTPPLKSALNPLSEDDQIDMRVIIDSLRAKYIVGYERASGADSLSQLMSNDKRFTDAILSALATAIREAIGEDKEAYGENLPSIYTARQMIESNNATRESIREVLRQLGLDV